MSSFIQELIAFSRQIHEELLAIKNALVNVADNLQKQTEAANEDRNADKKSRNAPPILRAELQVPHPIEVQTYAKDEKTGREWYKLVVDTLTLLGVLAYATIAAFQWCEMKKATQAAQDAVIEAKNNRIQSDNAFRETVNQSHLDQRAWVGFDVQLRTDKEGGSVKFLASGVIKNSGKTPALRMSFPRSVQVIKKWNEPMNYDDEWEKFVRTLKHWERTERKVIRKWKPKPDSMSAMFDSAFANNMDIWKGEGAALAPGTTFPVNLIPTPVTLPGLKDGQSQIIYWLGQLTYYDIFGKERHTTKICLRYTGDTLEFCPLGGNSMD